MTRSQMSGALALAALVVCAALQYAWNAQSVSPLSGYDAGGHAGYLLTLMEERRLPHPMDHSVGWSTFHPPVYYVLGSAVWSLLDPIGPRAVIVGLRAIGGIAILAAGLVAYALVRRGGASEAVALVATALVLFVPCVQMATAMIGNEALAAGLAALALPPILSLQRDPSRVRTAVLAGLLVGLACATKFTGLFTAVACVVPFLRTDFDGRMLRALAAGLAVGLLVAGPIYARNVALTGTPFPILREQEPTRSAEAANVLRERRLRDYLWVDPECLARPSLRHVSGEPDGDRRANPAMTNIWGLAYASIWYDAFAHRIPLEYHRDGVVAGPLLAALGLVPTAAMWLGFGLALRDAVRRRARSEDAPLVAIWLAGLAAFVSFTSWAPSAAAVKAAYLLPLAVPGAVFFARGVGLLGAQGRRAALVASSAAALAAAIIFTSGAVFPAQPEDRMAARWRLVGELLPDSHITEAVERLGPRPSPSAR